MQSSKEKNDDDQIEEISTRPVACSKLIDDFFNFNLLTRPRKPPPEKPKKNEIERPVPIDIQPENKELFKGIDYAKKYQKDLHLNLSRSFSSFNLTEITGTSLGVSFANSTMSLKQHLDDTTDESEIGRKMLVGRRCLQIFQFYQEILEKVQTNPITIIIGPTGCGKSTQVPQYVYDDCLSRDERCNILVSQPRKIAAVTLAQRVANERSVPLGKLVGYQVGLNKRVDMTEERSTQITYCTSGVILQKLILEKSMARYTHIILDEVHERDIDIDFLIVVIRRLLSTSSPNTKIILMSATMNTEQFSHFFKIPTNIEGEYIFPPIIDLYNVPSRRHMVSERYLEDITIEGVKDFVIDYKEPGISQGMYNIAAKLIVLLLRMAKKIQIETKQSDKAYNILVFAPGLHEIERMKEELTSGSIGQEVKKYTPEIIILHSSLSTEEQKLAFSISPNSKIILSTNIAESSVTLPAIMFVIDFCLTKYLTCSSGSQLSALVLDWATKNNLKQRAGRAGRDICKGTVYRLINKSYYNNKMADYPKPEIQLIPLETVIVKIKKLDLGTPLEILAVSLDPPDLKSIVDAVLTLKEHGGLLRFNDNEEFEYEDGILTYLGDIMSGMPCDIRITKLLVLGYLFSVLDEAIIIGASLNVQGVFLHSLSKKMEMYATKVKWSQGSCSDSIAVYNAYTKWFSYRNSNYFRNTLEEKVWCERNGLDYKNLNEMRLLIEEMYKRLKNYRITDLPTQHQLRAYHPNDKIVVLKCIMAGAFGMSNFFHQNVYSFMEEEGARTIKDMDVFRSVYFRNMDSHTWGQVYENQIKNAMVEKKVTSTTSNIEIDFDFLLSERVYMQFNEDKSLNKDSLDFYLGKAAPEVYKAVKLRTLNGTVGIKVMDRNETFLFAQEHKLGDYDMGVFTPNNNFYNRPELVCLPTAQTTEMSGVVTYVESCEKFFFRPQTAYGDDVPDIGDSYFKKINDDLDQLLNKSKFNIACLSTLPGAICQQDELVLFYPQDAKKFKRAEFVEVMKNKNCKIYLTDSGETLETTADSIFIFLGQKMKIIHEQMMNIENYPPRVFECKLREIQPSNLKSFNGKWTHEANNFFREGVINKTVNIKIFSVVGDVVICDLLLAENDKLMNWREILIENGHGQECEESHNSKANNHYRQRMRNSSIKLELRDEFKKKVDRRKKKIKKMFYVPEENCLSKIALLGPFSPLEITLRGIGREICGQVKVDGSSINNVLLNDDFLELHKKFFIAANIGYHQRNNSLKIYDTTAMPNIPGLSAILALMFSSYADIQRDKYNSRYVSILTGLGYDEERKRSYFPERDTSQAIEIELTEDDIQNINSLRFLMANLLFTDPLKEYPDINDRQKETILLKIKNEFLSIINTKREIREKQDIYNEYAWNTNFDDYNVKENVLGNRAIYPFIAIPKLYPMPDDALERLLNHLSNLERCNMIALPYKTCELCNKPFESENDLRVHLLTKMHIYRKNQLIKMSKNVQE